MGVFGVGSFVQWAKSSLPLFGSSLKKFENSLTMEGKFIDSEGIPYLASCTPSKWSSFSGKTIRFVVVRLVGGNKQRLGWSTFEKLFFVKLVPV